MNEWIPACDDNFLGERNSAQIFEEIAGNIADLTYGLEV